MAKKLTWEEAQALLVKKVEEMDIQDVVYEAALDVVSRFSDEIKEEFKIVIDGEEDDEDDDYEDGEEFYDDVRQDCMEIVYDKMRSFLHDDISQSVPLPTSATITL